MSAVAAPPGPAPQRGAAPGSGGDQVLDEHLGARLRRWRPMALAAGLLLVAALVTVWLRPQTSSDPLAIDNPRDEGTMALAELLRDEGIAVSQATSARAAVTAAHAGVTVALVNPSELPAPLRHELAESGADVVVVGSTYEDLTGLGQVRAHGVSAIGDLEAQCQDPDAQAAGSVSMTTGSLTLERAPGAQGCFPIDADHFAYTTEELPGGGTLRVISDASILTNDRLTEQGHAALGIRALGHHDSLIWLDASRTGDLGGADWRGVSAPPWLPVLMIHLAATILILAVVRGRRLGPLMTERLPAVVRSTETTIARGRLYRRAADRERAARALRRGSAMRLSRYLGLGASPGRGALLDALARATGMPHPVLDALLYGPAPRSDTSLADLAVNLDRLESKARSHD